MARKIVAMARMIVLMAGKIVAMTEKIVAMTVTIVAMALMIVSMTGKIVPMAGKIVQTSEKIVPMVGKIVRTTGKIIPMAEQADDDFQRTQHKAARFGNTENKVVSKRRVSGTETRNAGAQPGNTWSIPDHGFSIFATCCSKLLVTSTPFGRKCE
jgi:hypothetical protein